MSYNGIGLQTARGTGTNGYVQRNLASAKRQETRGHFERREQLAGTHEKNKERNRKQASLGKDPEISEHDQKRRIEVKCMDLRETLEDEDVDDDEIEARVAELRERLLKRMIPTRHEAEVKEEKSQGIEKAMREREPYQLRKLPRRDRSRSPPTKDEAESFIKGFKYESMY